jgi:ABC-2 type transport system permease protein
LVALLLHEIRSRRTAIIGWGIGIALFNVMYIVFYPEIAVQFGDIDLGDIAIYQAFGMTDLGTFAGYFTSSIVNMLPLLLGIYMIITGTGALAGEEEGGTLELMLAMPVARWQVVAAKALAIALAAFLILVVAAIGSWLGYLLIQDSVQDPVSGFDVVWATLYAWPISVALAMISLFLGAYLPARRLAAVVAAVVLVIGYFGNNLAPMLDTLQPLRPLFLYNYFDISPELLARGPEPADVTALLGIAAAFLILALIAFQRRDVTVGLWPWQRWQRWQRAR